MMITFNTVTINNYANLLYMIRRTKNRSVLRTSRGFVNITLVTFTMRMFAYPLKTSVR